MKRTGSTIGERIAVTWLVIVLGLVGVGYYFTSEDLAEAKTALGVILVLGGVLFTNKQQGRVMSGAFQQMEDFIKHPDLGMPEPPPPKELLPFFDLVVSVQSNAAEETRRIQQARAIREAYDQSQIKALLALDSSPQLTPRFDALLARVSEYVRCDAAGYFAFEHIGMPPSLVAWRGAVPSMPEKCIVASSLEKSLVDGQTSWCAAVSADWVPSSLRIWALENGLQSAWFAPALQDGKLVGMLACYSVQPRERDTSFEQWLLALARPMALAQESGRTFDSSSVTVTGVSRLNKFLYTIGRTTSLQETCEVVLGFLQAEVPHNRGAVLLAEGDEVFDVLACPYPGEIGYFVGSQLRRENTSALTVVTQRAPHVATDLSKETTFDDDLLIAEEGFKSRLVLPLVYAGRCVGCVYLASRSLAAFSTGQYDPLREAFEVVAGTLDVQRRLAGASANSSDATAAAGAGFFATALGNDLRSELQSSLALLEPASLALDGHAAAPPVQRVLTRARHMLALLDGVADIEKGDAETRDMQAEEFVLVDAVKDVEMELGNELASHKVAVNWDIPTGLPPVIADPRRFSSMVYQWLGYHLALSPQESELHFRTNLLPASWVKEKGRNYMPGAVLTKVQGDVDLLLLSITDRGTAPTPEQLSNFFAEETLSTDQADPRTKLLYVKKLVEAHKGQVWAEAGHDGVGTRIGVVLPQFSMDRLTFVGYVARNVKEAREAMVCLSLIGIGFAQKAQLRMALGESQYYRALKELEAVVHHTIREPIDTVRKFHSTDLLVIFARTDRAGAARIVERLQSACASAVWKNLPSAPAITLKTVTYPDDAQKPEEMVGVLEGTVAAR